MKVFSKNIYLGRKYNKKRPQNIKSFFVFLGDATLNRYQSLLPRITHQQTNLSVICFAPLKTVMPFHPFSCQSISTFRELCSLITSLSLRTCLYSVCIQLSLLRLLGGRGCRLTHRLFRRSEIIVLCTYICCTYQYYKLFIKESGFFLLNAI